MTAGYLIHGSYSYWLDSPISTTVTTHPIANLDFPTVTVCPPKGSHTALNYDLMQADSRSLTEDDRKNLIMTLPAIIESSHRIFIKNMLDIVNSKNLRSLYAGIQSVPQPFKQNGFKTVLWKDFGSVTTPNYGGEVDESYYRDKQDYHVVLEYPEDILEKIGNRSLVIQLEVITREEEGWQEEVE